MQSECHAVRAAVVGCNLQDRIGLDKSAAAELHVSINTISFHMRRVYEKLQVHSKSDPVSKALCQAADPVIAATLPV